MSLAHQIADVLAARDVVEIAAGHQSRVFDVRTLAGEHLVAKVLDASLVDAAEVARRMEAIAELAELDRRVCRPVPIDGRLVAPLALGGRAHLVACYERAEGTALAAARAADARLMGASLAGLHASLRRVRRHDLPHVAALRVCDTPDDGTFQLLHGDFGCDNVRRRDRVVRIFDFDDSGYGPVAFDVANALYLVLFSSMVSDRDLGYRAFEAAFLDGYGPTVDRADVERFVDLRVEALRRWTEAPAAAPIGIRTADPAWHEVLRLFVRRYEAGER